ncbi:uncharacterized protein LOC118279252 [Spodoptera frugiperda]|uniref:Uncharacterized protein LOC118279252 n=1 Tax=Spodoptera frugiperda TaxID=7108 RepID=A0A9R0DI28_SPOFR|nr:uncharacterized protein LOC118279252 [Spodoptera frugiperda]
MLDPQLAQIDTDLLIKTVKERPCLYARDSSKYGDASYKKVMWEEVASILFSDVWEKYNDDEKAEKAELAQRRWRNLRACFRRELNRQMDPKWIYGVSYKRRKYIYYNDLLFLRSEVDIGDDDTSQDKDIDLPVKTDEDTTTVTVDTNIEEIPISETRPVLKTKTEKVEVVTPEPIEISTKSEPDSTNFALSLVPMLNMLPVYKRIDAQISILTVLKKFLQNEGEDDLEKEVEVRKEKKKNDYSRKRKVNETTVCVEIKSEAGSDVDDVLNYL